LIVDFRFFKTLFALQFGALVGVIVTVAVLVGVGDAVKVGVWVVVGDGVKVAVGVIVDVAVGVKVGVIVGVGFCNMLHADMDSKIRTMPICHILSM